MRRQECILQADTRPPAAMFSENKPTASPTQAELRGHERIPRHQVHLVHLLLLLLGESE